MNMCWYYAYIDQKRVKTNVEGCRDDSAKSRETSAVYICSNTGDEGSIFICSKTEEELYRSIYSKTARGRGHATIIITRVTP